MKNFCTISLLFFLSLFSFNTFATTYYLSSSSGSDNNSGTDASSPWRSIDKLNSFYNLRPGDYVLFKRGDVFYGGIKVNNSGSSGNPITYGAYGSGAKPIITGFTNIKSWNNVGGNIWESSDAVSNLSYTNMVAVNGVNTAMGRYPNSTGPNTGYLYIKSHSGNSSITAIDGLNSTNWTGAGIIIRKERWALERGTVTGQSGNTIYYDDPALYVPKDGFGFFIQNDARTLDANGEWYYNSSNHKLKIYSTAMPSDVKIASIQNLVSIDRKSYILFDNIAFTGSNSNALSCLNYGSTLTIQNCDISYTGDGAISSKMANTTIQNNTLTFVNSFGIHTSEMNSNILNNVIKNVEMLEGMDGSSVSAGIEISGPNSTVQNNTLENLGYVGIKFSGANSNIKNNLISKFCITKDDGSGIYVSKTNSVGSVIDGNIVLNAVGANNGSSNTNVTDASGIMVDAYGTGISVINNTVANCVNIGIKIHGANSILVKNNTCYNNGLNDSWSKGAIELLSSSDYLIRNVTVEGNIFFARTKNQYAYFGYGANGILSDLLSFGTANANYFAKPIDPSSAIMANSTQLSIEGWQAMSGKDASSLPAPKTVSDPNDLIFEYNASNSSKTINLDANYIDVRNVSYNGTITLKPYTSAVLIRNGAKTETSNDSPVATVGPDQDIQLPKNTIDLPGSGNDSDGSIVSYSWSQISGPSATLTNINSAQAVASDLSEGKYIFRLTVTDNDGATGTADLNVDVHGLQSQSLTSNLPPVANVGSDRIIQLPKESIVLPGSGTDSDGTVVSYSWEQLDGPSKATMENVTSAEAVAGDLIAGEYRFQLTVTDNQGATASKVLNVTVSSDASNQPPMANVGSNRVIQLPKKSIVLPGKGTDPDGTVVSYLWTQLEGPSEATMVNVTSAEGVAGNMIAGDYQFQLTVTDDQGATGSKILYVKVNPDASNQLPVANVGSNRVIQLPKKSIVLPGSGIDLDGTIVSYLWTQLAGPSEATMVNVTSAEGVAGDMIAGDYRFELTVTDNQGATGSKILYVTVNPEAPNQPPVANVGSNRVIQLPKKSIVLPGKGTDPDGTVVSYLWTQLEGPSKATMVNVTSAEGVAGDMVAGDYQFQLTVTDDDGATGSQILYVKVNNSTTSFRMANLESDTDSTKPVEINNDVLAVSQDSSLNLNSITNLSTESNIQLNIYPNPTQNFINLQLSGLNTGQNVDIVITNLNGEKIYKESSFIQGTTVKKIDLSRLNNGTYIVSVFYNGKNVKSSKIIKL